MTKYYKVYLTEYFSEDSDTISEKHEIICKLNPLLTKRHKQFVFEELITKKIIYPTVSGYQRCLTYQEEDFGYHKNFIEITPSEAKQYLESKSGEELLKYISNILRLEQKEIMSYEENKRKERERKKEEKKLVKSINSILRKTKKR